MEMELKNKTLSELKALEQSQINAIRNSDDFEYIHETYTLGLIQEAIQEKTKMKPTLMIFSGLPASGKTTKAKQMEAEGWTRVNRDDIRIGLGGLHGKEREATVRELRNAMIARALKLGRNVVSDDTNIEPTTRKELADIAASCGADVKEDNSFLSVSVEECIRRDALRAASVGPKVIHRMAKRLAQVESLKARLPKVLVQDSELDHAIMVDLDGTLALIWSRDPYDASRCMEDIPNEAVVSAIDMAIATGNKIIFCSGRSDKYRKETLEWLAMVLGNSTAQWAHLFMRAEGDTRSDVDVKREIFDKHIRDKFYINFVLDDRDSVVKLWREIGLTCFQVNYGNF